MPQRSARLKVALAAIIVAVIGAVALVATQFGETMANFADETFGRGEFNVADAEWHIESSTNGTSWSQTDTANAATLSVSNVPLVPGRAAFARFSLRVQGNSALSAGTVSMGTGAQQPGSTQAGNYRMRAVSQTGGTCNASSFAAGSSYLVGTNTTYGNMLTTPAGTFMLPAPPSYSQPGAARTVCLEFSLADTSASDALNGTSVSVRWTFTATQN